MTTQTIALSDLPTPIRTYLDAHARRDVDAAIVHFAPEAEVTDEGNTYRGPAEVREFLSSAGSQFTYTSELTGAQRIDNTHWLAVVHLEGDFPGRVADLRYRFTMAGDQITRLAIVT